MFKIKFYIVCLLLLSSCFKRDKEYYNEMYNKNKDQFLEIRSIVRSNMKDNFSTVLEYTGKRFILYVYPNEVDSNFFVEKILSRNQEYKISTFMHNTGISRIIVYKTDSTKYYFRQIDPDTMIIMDSPMVFKLGEQIDSNVVLHLYK